MSGRTPEPYLAENLRRLRLERGYTQRQLAARAGTSADTVVKLERGERRVWPRTLQRLAQALEVQPGELLRATQQMEVIDLANEGYSGAAAAVAQASPEEREKLVAQDRAAAKDAISGWLQQRTENAWFYTTAHTGHYAAARKAADGDALDLVQDMNQMWREVIEERDE